MNSLSSVPVTVLGVGNVILRDEGFGVRVMEYLDKNYEFEGDVQLIDGGTLGIELTKFITGAKKLLIIDSVNSGGDKGKIFHFINDDVLAHFEDKISAHEVGIKDVLALLKVTGKYPDEVVVIGAEPYDLNAGVGLSEDMQKLLPKVAEDALKILENWEIKITKKSSVDIDFLTIAEDMANSNTL